MPTRLARPGMLVLCCGFLLAHAAFADDKKLPPVNEEVLKFARASTGKQVGNGECWTLADQALAAAKGKRPGRNGYGTYVFGRELKADEAILPGDIVQLMQAKFVAKNSQFEMPQHTAVVTQVDGSKIEILHQNFNNSRQVAEFSFDKTELTKGKVTFYRPQPAGR